MECCYRAEEVYPLAIQETRYCLRSFYVTKSVETSVRLTLDIFERYADLTRIKMAWSDDIERAYQIFFRLD